MDTVTSFVVLAALTTGLVEVVKRATGLENRYLPLTALILGIGLTLIGNIANLTSLAVLTGIAVGLSSSGLFDQSKLFKKEQPLTK